MLRSSVGALILLYAVTAAGGAAPDDQSPPPAANERSASCVAELRPTPDGELVEGFFNDVVRELAPAGASLADTSQWIARLTVPADPQVRATNHARLHLMLGSRMDDETHAAVHALMDAMLSCLADDAS